MKCASRISQIKTEDGPVSFDPYQILGVTIASSDKDIRSAFRKKSLQYHPDKNHEEGAGEKFLEITKA